MTNEPTVKNNIYIDICHILLDLFTFFFLFLFHGPKLTYMITALGNKPKMH